ncbi:MAG: IS630 family transposase [Candidatus Saccharimonadales bacterium]
MDGRKNSTYELRVRAVRAVLRGRSMSDVADAYETDRSTVCRWVKRFQADGEEGLERRPTSGRPRTLEDLTENELRNIVLQPASDFGYESDLWTVGRLHAVIEDKYRICVSNDTIWRRLREAGLTYQKPERQYYELDEESRQDWLRTDVPKIRKTVEKYRAILYFQDEANVSLTAFLGKTWSPCGQTPKAKVTGKRGGVAAMSAVSRQGNLLFRLHNKRIASPEVIDFLKQMLTHHNRRHLVVVMDQAPPHTSKKTKSYINSQERLHVFHLPKYSPDWNPDEKVWNHLKHQELTRHQAKTKEELTKLARRKLQSMAKRPSLMRGIYFRCCVAELFG